MNAYLLSPASRGALAHESSHAWQALRWLIRYRVIVATLFVVLATSGYLIKPLGSNSPRLFTGLSIAYLLLAVAAVTMNRLRRPGFKTQVYLLVGVDIALLTPLMHASGGVTSGLGMLLVVTIAGASLLVAGRAAVGFAAMASLAVLGETIYAQLETPLAIGAYPQAGLLGITFFATAVLAHILAKRVRESEALAAQRGVDLANMAQLTEHIIERMQTGILVVDQAQHVRLMNESAWYMLGMPSAAVGPSLDKVSPELLDQVRAWRKDPVRVGQAIHPTASMADIMPRFAQIGWEGDSGTLIFLEDTASLAQQAQQMKLASLGRLTASIAHEIRNPLGAISHAGQLLAESPHLHSEDGTLTRIIGEHTRRINTIIENILQLSRRDRSKPVLINLRDYLGEFVADFSAAQGLDPATIAMQLRPEPLAVRFDPSQLSQILTNLCENGLRHSAPSANHPKLEIISGVTDEFRRPYLDIVDHGPGISPEVAEHIFEPFFTTATNGTGLGLYISRELAESNQAQLTYLAHPGGGACFRITFQDPRRQIEVP